MYVTSVRFSIGSDKFAIARNHPRASSLSLIEIESGHTLAHEPLETFATVIVDLLARRYSVLSVKLLNDIIAFVTRPA